MHITLTPSVISGNDVLTVEHLAKAYGEKQLFSDISFEIKRGERVALIGANGTGKTTILKILNQKIEADAGSIHLGTNVHLGYYDQEQQVLHMEKTLIDEIADDYPKLTHTKIRNVLAAFLFTDEDVFKRVSDLSGGERGRLSLAKLMLSEANFLILDEPTNHLDITSKEILESALNSYEGTVFFVSHDRYFINKTATRILNLTERSIINYIGNYDYYLEKKETNEQAYLNPKTTVSVVESEISGEGKADWQSQKEEQAKLRKLRNQIRKIEEEIDTLETRLAEIDEAFSSAEVATNSAKLNELHGEQVKIQERLEILYEDWEKLSDD
jgi:ATP-binding cassette subfamily F protein 3